MSHEIRDSCRWCQWTDQRFLELLHDYIIFNDIFLYQFLRSKRLLCVIWILVHKCVYAIVLRSLSTVKLHLFFYNTVWWWGLKNSLTRLGRGTRWFQKIVQRFLVFPGPICNFFKHLFMFKFEENKRFRSFTPVAITWQMHSVLPEILRSCGKC